MFRLLHISCRLLKFKVFMCKNIIRIYARCTYQNNSESSITGWHPASIHLQKLYKNVKCIRQLQYLSYDMHICTLHYKHVYTTYRIVTGDSDDKELHVI